MTLSQQAPLVERPHSAKCLGERFQDAFLAAWGQERGVAYADLPAEAHAKWDRAAVAFVCTLSNAPSEAAARITELEARAERAEAQCRVLREALGEIAQGITGPEKEGHYLAHRKCVAIARQVLSHDAQRSDGGRG